MTRIDFYVLDNAAMNARETFICRLAEKIFNGGHRIYIHTDDLQQAESLDKLLWTFRQGSFVPHALSDTEQADHTPIIIGTNHEPDQQEVLINCAKQVPAFFSRFERVAEIVNKQDDSRTEGRNRYSYYRDRGYALHSHDISG